MCVSIKILFLFSAIRGSFGVPKLDYVINGIPTSIDRYPYFAYLAQYYTGDLKCGGAIIKTNMILTAAHCLNAYDFQVYVNVDNHNDLFLETPYDVKYIILHPKYYGRTRYDIGLVVLKSHIELSDTVQLIEIASYSPRIGSKVSVAGFGGNNCDAVWDPKYETYICEGPTSTVLRSALLRVIKNQGGVLYTRGKNRNTCYGDSGSPVVYNNKVVGIVSSGEKHDCSGYDTQAAVAPHYRWIKKHMAKF